MNVTDASTSIELVSCFGRCLEPRPAALRFLPLVGTAKSNQDRLVDVILGSRRSQSERLGDAPGGPDMRRYGHQEFRSFLTSISEFLPAHEQDAHRARLETLQMMYELSYGPIIEALRSAQSSTPAVLETAFRATLMGHGTDTTEPLTVSATELSADLVLGLLDRTLGNAKSAGSAPPSFLMLLSGVQMSDGTLRFIPMLDFRLSSAPFHCDVVEALVRAADAAPGAIVESGQSYHYYGFRLMTREGLLQFAHKALLMVPFVDARYLGHRLMGGELRLRISGRTSAAAPPRVCRILE